MNLTVKKRKANEHTEVYNCEIWRGGKEIIISCYRLLCANIFVLYWMYLFIRLCLCLCVRVHFPIVVIVVAIHNKRRAQSVQMSAVFGVIDVVLEEHLQQNATNNV